MKRIHSLVEARLCETQIMRHRDQSCVQYIILSCLQKLNCHQWKKYPLSIKGVYRGCYVACERPAHLYPPRVLALARRKRFVVHDDLTMRDGHIVSTTFLVEI